MGKRLVRRICVFASCRDRADKEAIHGRTYKVGTAVVVETVERSERTNPDEYRDVHPGWCSGRGLCEFDDMLHNMIGAVIGVGLVMVIKKMFKVEETE